VAETESGRKSFFKKIRGIVLESALEMKAFTPGRSAQQSCLFCPIMEVEKIIKPKVPKKLRFDKPLGINITPIV